VAVLAVLAACGGGGVQGEYTSAEGLSTYNFKANGKVEITTRMFGIEQTQEMDYEYEDGKIRLGPSGMRMVFPVDEDGCFDAGGLWGKMCKAGSAAAQPASATASGAPAARPATREGNYAAAMRSDLRNLVTAEESYFANNIIYTTSLPSLGFTPSTGVTVQVTAATGTGWSASASHTASNTVCGIYVGSATPVIAGQTEGQPKCR
jgi:hypothetical protein